MRADELRSAAARVTEILIRADLTGVINQMRGARGGARAVAADLLHEVGCDVARQLQVLSTNEQLVVKHLHLGSLVSSAYWSKLRDATCASEQVHPEVVRLASRVMFATGNLPGLVHMLAEVATAPVDIVATPSPFADPSPLAEGEARLIARLTDAGERAADPDRIARAIDGVDMLYSACASVARKSIGDLRLDLIAGVEDRDIHFAGESDTVTAVSAVLKSIPDVIAGYSSSDELDLDELVALLPVFEDLRTLEENGSFNRNDLKDIRETMYQGAVLAVESGITVATVAESPSTSVAADDGHGGTRRSRAQPGPVLDGQIAEADAAKHYDRYLKEREAMQNAASTPGELPVSLHERRRPKPVSEQEFELPAHPSEGARPPAADSVEELLEALGKSRRDR